MNRIDSLATNYAVNAPHSAVTPLANSGRRRAVGRARNRGR